MSLATNVKINQRRLLPTRIVDVTGDNLRYTAKANIIIQFGGEILKGRLGIPPSTEWEEEQAYTERFVELEVVNEGENNEIGRLHIAYVIIGDNRYYVY